MLGDFPVLSGIAHHKKKKSSSIKMDSASAKFSARGETIKIFIASMTLVTSLALNEAIKDTLKLIPTGNYLLASEWIYAILVITILIVILKVRSVAALRHARAIWPI